MRPVQTGSYEVTTEPAPGARRRPPGPADESSRRHEALHQLGSDRPGETSRLVFSQHQLLEICALFGTLIADLDGVYDPSQYNDRLLLGLNRPASCSTSCSTYPSLPMATVPCPSVCGWSARLLPRPHPCRRQRYPTCWSVKGRPKAVRQPAALTRSATSA